MSLGASYAEWLEHGTTRYFQFPTFTSKGLIHTRIDRHNLMQKETPMSILLAHVAGAPEEGEVTTFAMRPKSNVGGTPLIPDWLAEIMGRSLGTVTIKEGEPSEGVEELIRRIMGQDREEHLYDEPLEYEDGDLNHRVLWARVWQVLGGDEADVSFDPNYHECEMPGCRHPAIHGPGVSPYTVNGAIMDVLDRANQMELIEQALQCMADTQDEDGWVYHSGLVL